MSDRKYMQKRLLWACLPVCLLLSSCRREQSDIYMMKETLSDMEAEVECSEVPEETEEKIYVHVSGAVQVPGVYVLDAGIRGYMAVEAAGGFALDASEDSVNLAQPLSDGQMLYIPTAEEAAGIERKTEIQKLGLVNINTASEKELMELPGIGEARASQIAAYREQHGAFQNPEELMLVDGIKESVYAKLKDMITIE